MTEYRIVDTDNFGGDYPNEQFVGRVYRCRENAEEAADALNGPFEHAQYAPRYFKVVELPYSLQPGFEP